MKKIFIYSKRIARDLIKKRYNIIDIAENQKNKNWTVFVFEDTKSIRQYLKTTWNLEI